MIKIAMVVAASAAVLLAAPAATATTHSPRHIAAVICPARDNCYQGSVFTNGDPGNAVLHWTDNIRSWQIRPKIRCSGGRLHATRYGGWVIPVGKVSGATCPSAEPLIIYAAAQYRAGPGQPLTTNCGYGCSSALTAYGHIRPALVAPHQHARQGCALENFCFEARSLTGFEGGVSNNVNNYSAEMDYRTHIQCETVLGVLYDKDGGWVTDQRDTAYCNGSDHMTKVALQCGFTGQHKYTYWVPADGRDHQIACEGQKSG